MNNFIRVYSQGTHNSSFVLHASDALVHDRASQFPELDPRVHSPGRWPLYPLSNPLPQPPVTPHSMFPETGQSLTLFFLSADSLLK